MLALAFVLGTCWLETASAQSADLQRLRALALELVNADRGRQQLQSMSASERLDRAAQAHAADMLERDYYAHKSPEGDTVRDRYLVQGGNQWQLVAENIAVCRGCPGPVGRERVEAFHRGWMNSEGHRENILSDGLSRFGFGLAAEAGRVFAVQTFAGPGSSSGSEDAAPLDSLDGKRQASLALDAINAERRKRGMPPLAVSAELVGAAAQQVRSRPAQDGPGEPEPVEPYSLLSDAARQRWQTLSVLSAACGGCGVESTTSDIQMFVQRWLDDEAYRARLLQADLTHLGFAIQANGKGRKNAAAVLGTKR
ncbi:MAG: hypothetical protein KDK91_00410 [Gammaproteobacteria bacterium]|nr:hypothetical protein [Gammaproteobacteria bacterium]